MQQILVVAKLKGLIPPAPHNLDHTAYLSTIWGAIRDDPDTQPAAIKVVGLVGQYDVLILLDRLMTEFFLN